jgi:short-subunit dehydrogenase
MMFKNKTIVLTGASGGIGSAIAKALSDEGAILILTSRERDMLDELNHKLGGQHHCLMADLTTQEGLADLVNLCRQFESGIDMLINNAGLSDFSLLENIDAERIERLVAVNLISPMLVCQALMPLLKAQHQARIINIGSTFGSIGFPGFSVYCGSKFGLRGFSEALRRELMDSSVAVYYFAPRATNTTINNNNVVMMNKELKTTMDEPEVVAAKLISFLRRHSDINFYLGWPEKLFVRINSILPQLVDKSIFKQLATIKRYL